MSTPNQLRYPIEQRVRAAHTTYGAVELDRAGMHQGEVHHSFGDVEVVQCATEPQVGGRVCTLRTI